MKTKSELKEILKTAKMHAEYSISGEWRGEGTGAEHYLVVAKYKRPDYTGRVNRTVGFLVVTADGERYGSFGDEGHSLRELNTAMHDHAGEALGMKTNP